MIETTNKFEIRGRSMVEAQFWGPSAVVSADATNAFGENRADRAGLLLQHLPLFSNIPAGTCREIVSAARKEVYKRRETIHLAGDPVRQIVLLTSGCVKIVQVGLNGSEVILRLNGPGEVFGMVGSNTQSRHCSTAQALTASTALVWGIGAFDSLAERFPVLRRNTAHILCKRLEDLEERFREISTEKVATRLSHEIVRLLNQVGRRVNGAIQINLSREELAQLIGTTLFTVSRLLSDWDEQGVISARRESVTVKNLQALVELSDRE
jgi:CRP/FNR family transcriptional regulator, nitrogen oxide reductase regulator